MGSGDDFFLKTTYIFLWKMQLVREKWLSMQGRADKDWRM
jgi:hypothetical protein